MQLLEYVADLNPDRIYCTVTLAVPVKWDMGSVALISTVPTSTAVTTPFEPVTLLTIAVPVFDEYHSTDVVRSSVVASSYSPFAVS